MGNRFFSPGISSKFLYTCWCSNSGSFWEFLTGFSMSAPLLFDAHCTGAYTPSCAVNFAFKAGFSGNSYGRRLIIVIKKLHISDECFTYSRCLLGDVRRLLAMCYNWKALCGEKEIM